MAAKKRTKSTDEPKMADKGNIFFRVHKSAMESGLFAALGDKRWFLLCALKSFSDNNGYCCPSEELLAQIMGVTKRTVSRYVNDLKEFEWKGNRILKVVEKQVEGKPKGFVHNEYYISPLSQLSIFDEEIQPIQMGERKRIKMNYTGEGRRKECLPVDDESGQECPPGESWDLRNANGQKCPSSNDKTVPHTEDRSDPRVGGQECHLKNSHQNNNHYKKSHIVDGPASPGEPSAPINSGNIYTNTYIPENSLLKDNISGSERENAKPTSRDNQALNQTSEIPTELWEKAKNMIKLFVKEWEETVEEEYELPDGALELAAQSDLVKNNDMDLLRNVVKVYAIDCFHEFFDSDVNFPDRPRPSIERLFMEDCGELIQRAKEQARF